MSPLKDLHLHVHPRDESTGERSLIPSPFAGGRGPRTHLPTANIFTRDSDTDKVRHDTTKPTASGMNDGRTQIHGEGEGVCGETLR